MTPYFSYEDTNMHAQSGFIQAACKAEPDHFPFLKLPLELRTMIYDLLLVTKLNTTITPDPTRHNEYYLEYGGRCYGIEGVGLIGTCKQIHDEATTVLYGRNKFAFMDDRGLPGYSYHSWCELDSLPIWLRYIGRDNVRKIRALRFELSGLCAAFSYSEPDDLPHQTDALGDALIQAFDFLSSNHNLHTLEFVFPSAEEFSKRMEKEREGGWLVTAEEEDSFDEKAYAIFFRRSDTAVLEALRKLRGVRNFVCSDCSEVWPAATGVMRTVKSEIESQDPRKADGSLDAMAKPIAAEQRVSTSKRSLSIWERLSDLEPERAETIDIIGHLLCKLREQGEDIAGLMKEVDEVSSRMNNRNWPHIG